MIPARMPVLLLAALCLSPTPAHAQIGPLIDWINKMSGPKFWGIETSVTIGHRPGQFLPKDMRPFQAPAITDSVRSENPELARCLLSIARLTAPGAAGSRMPTFDEKSVDRLRASFDRYSPVLTLTDLSATALPVAQTMACDINDQLTHIIARKVPRLGFFVRVGGTAAVNEKSTDDEAEIYLLALQPTAGLEYHFGGASGFHPAFSLEAGMALYQFFGDIEDFRHQSVVATLSTRPFAGDESRILRALRLGVGRRGFPTFDPDAFGPGFDLPDGWDWVWTFFLGFDFTIGY